MTDLKLVNQDNFLEFVDTFIADSSCIIVGQKGHGKSKLAKHIARALMTSKKTTVQIFDSSLSWLNDFDFIPFQFCADYIEFDAITDSHMLYSIEFEDSQDVNFVVREIIRENYLKRRTLRIAEYMTNKMANTLAETNHKKEDIDTYYIGIIEEAQNFLSTYTLMARENRKWLKIISDCRNLRMSLIFIGQRLADISAKAVERANCYFFGKTISDNDLIKIRRILGSDNKHLIEKIKTLEKGQFLFWDGETACLIDLPEFKPKPHETPQLYFTQKRWFERNLESIWDKELTNEIRFWFTHMQKGLKEAQK